MAKVFCGKNCDECIWKADLNCAGCLNGPGNPYRACECRIAKCCLEKGHEECATCGFVGSCGLYMEREQQPKERYKKLEEEQKQNEIYSGRAAVLGKWLTILFWLVVPSLIGGILSNDNISGMPPVLYNFGSILKAVTGIAYGLILLKVSSEEAGYRTAGICTLISAAAGFAALVIIWGAKVPTWSLLFSIPSLIIAIFAEYKEYSAHAAVLMGIDFDLSAKWDTLWKWYAGFGIAIMAGMTLAFLQSVLGLLIVTVSSLGFLVVGILKLVYLYLTAKTFREYE
ncbi:MAG: DUF3795 domain-containing protein [Lachnospiraceae bacterium]|nr:DUF3795 domain-containing protein [Lachnospiraceae bacterium]